MIKKIKFISININKFNHKNFLFFLQKYPTLRNIYFNKKLIYNSHHKQNKHKLKLNILKLMQNLQYTTQSSLYL